MSDLITRGMLTTERMVRLRNVVEDAIQAGYIAASVYGVPPQRAMAIEECAELIAALCQEDRGRVTEGDVRYEVADVLIMSLQLVVIYGVDECIDALADKTRRLRGRVIPALEKQRAMKRAEQ